MNITLAKKIVPLTYGINLTNDHRCNMDGTSTFWQ